MLILVLVLLVVVVVVVHIYIYIYICILQGLAPRPPHRALARRHAARHVVQPQRPALAGQRGEALLLAQRGDARGARGREARPGGDHGTGRLPSQPAAPPPVPVGQVPEASIG